MKHVLLEKKNCHNALSYAETVRAEAQAKKKQLLGTETSGVYKSLRHCARTSNVCVGVYSV